ncbi:NAD(P)/FAD-dependent oxidoreductase [Pedobacter flavus]|uniref:FAD-dependent oxidoreductase n=1 Tax=Pedobacter flavus TaxID=3113906 RepID=A0ABU7H2B3_9SPHI|nr:FAD-dependent oxidoreductase [Pedobacter sp. VNH31]MEE1885381.1 FAD-dependent oxidoreductase [Pedobacter sp. VNH31]
MADVIIIGGGIVGLSSAYYLTKAGYKVTVLDKDEIVGNCSYGNAGMIVPSHFVPLATPGMVKQGIKWMFNSKSPFYVRPSLNMNLVKWGLQFLRSSNEKHVENSAIPLRDFSLLSKQLINDLAKDPDFNFELENKGILAFYKTEKVAEEEAELCAKAVELGLEMKVLNLEECKKLQPNLDLDVLGAVHYQCDSHIYPAALMQNLQDYLLKNGVGILKKSAVTAFQMESDKILSVMVGNKEFKADHFVLATGSWSTQVAKLAGENISIMPGKGYSFEETVGNESITIPALLCEARVAITPMNGKIRFGGTMELDRVNNKINIDRVKGIVESVPKYFPQVKPNLPELNKIWFGFRPASPDGLPYIGRSKHKKNLIIATGHGMMGLSLGQATGKLVCEIISEQPLSMPLAPFAVNRFS